MNLKFFERASNLQFINIMHHYYLKNQFFVILPNGHGTMGAILAPEGCSVDFKYVVLTLLLIYINLHLHPFFFMFTYVLDLSFLVSKSVHLSPNSSQFRFYGHLKVGSQSKK